MTLQEQLCEKMRVEQSAYCLWLTAQPPEEILHHAYEYSVREDIILATEEMNLTPAQVRALLKSPVPLADVYKDFSKLCGAPRNRCWRCLAQAAWCWCWRWSLAQPQR